jgi:hypothetical protein
LKFSISDKTERWGNNEDIGYVGSEHESMRSECEKDGNCEDAEADKMKGMVNMMRLVKLNRGL